MEASVVDRTQQNGRRFSKGGQRPQPDRLTQALFNAKKQQKTVKFCLAQEAYFTDETGCFEATIIEVDKFDLKVMTHPDSEIKNREIWIKKAAILSTEIL